MDQDPEDFDAIDFELWRLECAMQDAERLLDPAMREDLQALRRRLHDRREARNAPAR